MWERIADGCIFIIIRHGETDWNRETRLQGQIDVPLNGNGRQQSVQVAATLRAKSSSLDGPLCDAIVSSPLQRARETADIVKTELGLPQQTVCLPGLMEWNAGVLQGHRLDEIPHLFPEAYDNWSHRKNEHFVYEGGESIAQRYARVVASFEKLALEHLGQRVLVFGHSGVLGDVFRRCL